ncbi:hypothetical protein J4573_53090 [Actinomadura barringtoniae]|uniref:Lipoprotein n=1 Tax=Actinomadura barringtoniae TaxID=1427535 RepID=A0A939PNG8_9ACTN|nr:hypothetical protein [Actinomadura barringtoniae]MBO2455895.1 hypothetical protein [Actinomadura barringtoniae]
MVVRRIIVGVALASTATFSVAGCGSSSDDGGSGGSGGASEKQVAWAAKACGVINQTPSLPVPKLELANAAKSKASIVKLLNDVSVRLRTLSMNLKGLGAPPVTGGEATFNATMSKLSMTSSTVSTARLRLQMAKVTDTKSLEQALGPVKQAFTQYGTYQGPQQDLRANPALATAFDKVPTCQPKKA